MVQLFFNAIFFLFLSLRGELDHTIHFFSRHLLYNFIFDRNLLFNLTRSFLSSMLVTADRLRTSQPSWIWVMKKNAILKRSYWVWGIGLIVLWFFACFAFFLNTLIIVFREDVDKGGCVFYREKPYRFQQQLDQIWDLLKVFRFPYIMLSAP